MSVCVYLLVTTVSPAKTDEPIDIPLEGGRGDSYVPKEPCTRMNKDHLRKEATLWGFVLGSHPGVMSQRRCAVAMQPFSKLLCWTVPFFYMLTAFSVNKIHKTELLRG